jgi:hypothetical protein
MKNIFVTLIVSTMLLLFGCGSSANIPSKEESKIKIASIKPQLDSLSMVIDQQTNTLPKGYDLVSRTRESAIDSLLLAVTNRSVNDIHIDFLQTRPLWKEDKSVLGIQFTNYVDIDTGSLNIDLKKFIFTEFSKNKINAEIEIEGTGTLRVSGSYLGVKASTSPKIHFYLNDQIQFSVGAGDSDYIRLMPIPKKMLLKASIAINLLGWNIPYYKEIPLEASQLIKPVLIPSAIRSEIIFPLPAPRYGGEQMEFVKRFLHFTKSSVGATNNFLEYRSNIDFEKE